jgi:CelD/BcsL family acetyltransferase involved in cellulose biosynthesis
MADRVSIARSSEEVEELRERWQRMPVRQVHSDIDFYLAVVRTRTEVLRPHVVLVERDGNPAALLAARLEQIPFEASIGYRVVHRPLLRTLTVAHGGLVSNDGEERLRALLRAVDECFRKGEADVIVFPSLEVGSAEYRVASSMAGPLRRQHFAETRTHHRLVLPASFDEFLASRGRKVRSGLRNHANRLRRVFGDELTVDSMREPADFDCIFRDLVQVAAKTYQRGLGASFANTAERRELVRLSLERGWFRAWVLYRGGTPIAFWQGSVFDRVYRSGTTGFHPEYAVHRVGTYLLMRVIEDLCADSGVDVLDYGLGDAEYKRRFGSDSWQERDVVVFAPTLRGVRLNATRSAILGSALGAKRVLTRIGLSDRVKKTWRRRLSRAG